MAKKATKKHLLRDLLIFILLVCIVAGVYYYYKNYYIKTPPGNYVEVDGELSIHFLELGNDKTGDSIYIKAGEVDILVDAGSRENSAETISNYINNYVKDGILEYTIITHADQDHIAGFGASDGIFSLYECKTIIDFPKSNKTTAIYNKYKQQRQAEIDSGATHYTALECVKEQNGAKSKYQLTESISITFLYQKYYEQHSSHENNYSVCFMLTHGDRNFLFIGDLEEAGEFSLIENNNLPQVEVYKASHHGSNTSTTKELLEVIKPKIVTVTCVAGSTEYTSNLPNTFPTQNFIDKVSKYTDKVYVTSYIDVEFNQSKGEYQNSGKQKSLNGNIVVISKVEGVSVSCTNDNKKLKESDWFINNRSMPSNWKGTVS